MRIIIVKHTGLLIFCGKKVKSCGKIGRFRWKKSEFAEKSADVKGEKSKFAEKSADFAAF